MPITAHKAYYYKNSQCPIDPEDILNNVIGVFWNELKRLLKKYSPTLLMTTTLEKHFNTGNTLPTFDMNQIQDENIRERINALIFTINTQIYLLRYPTIYCVNRNDSFGLDSRNDNLTEEPTTAAFHFSLDGITWVYKFNMDGFIASLKDPIITHLEKFNKRPNDPHAGTWYYKTAQAAFNALAFIVSVPTKLITGSWFFNRRGNTYDSAENVIATLDKISKKQPK